MDKELLALRISVLLNHIDEILKDTENMTADDLKGQSVLLRATCFSIGQIGEQMINIESDLKDKYPDLPWKRARGMRNLIVHEYQRIDSEMVYSTIKNDLPPLKEAFEAIKNELIY